MQKAEDSQVEEDHGHRVVEQAQDVDGVDAVGGAAHEEKHIGWYLRNEKKQCWTVCVSLILFYSQCPPSDKLIWYWTPMLLLS